MGEPHHQEEDLDRVFIAAKLFVRDCLNRLGEHPSDEVISTQARKVVKALGLPLVFSPPVKSEALDRLVQVADKKREAMNRHYPGTPAHSKAAAELYAANRRVRAFTPRSEG